MAHRVTENPHSRKHPIWLWTYTRQCFQVGAIGALLTLQTLNAQTSPNFLVILLDDIGREWIGCYGSEGVQTPNIDLLAARGVRFEHCYSTPLCSTSRVVFLTGRYPYRTGWIWHSDPAAYGGGYFDWHRETSFARVLQMAGYQTAVTGKWQINNLYEQPNAPQEHGFGEHALWPGGQRDDPIKSRRYWDPYVVVNGFGSQRKGAFGPDVYCEFLIDFMSRNRNRPFLAYAAMHLVHTPLVTTPLAPEPQSPADSRKANSAQYAAMVRYADYLVGRLLKALRQMGLRENTIVLLAGDNGSPRSVTGRAWNREIRGGKGLLTEAGIDVPLIVNGPGLVAGGRSLAELADFSDIFPTILELAGVEPPKDVAVDGRSLVPLLRGTVSGQRQWIFSQYANTRVVRNRRFKLYSTGSIFDVQNDILEETDLRSSQDPQVVAARTSLRSALDYLPGNAQLPFEPRSQSYFRAKGIEPEP